MADRDKQIAILEKKLAEAKEDMDTNVTLMEGVRADIRRGTYSDMCHYASYHCKHKNNF